MFITLLLLASVAEGGSCQASKQCEKGLSCRAQRCVITGTGESCATSKDCKEPLACVENVCDKPSASLAPAPTSQPAIGPHKPPKGYKRRAPPLIPYVEGQPIPENADLVTRGILPLWATGIGVLAGAWIATGLTTSVLCLAGCVPWAVPVSWVPLAGPVADLFVSSPPVAVFMVLMTIAQLGGTGMILGGLLARKKFLRYRVEPTVTLGNYGVSLVGAF